jgi:hypothetical protein
MSHDDNQGSEATSAPSGPSSAPGSEVPEHMPAGPANPISQRPRAANGVKALDPSASKTSEGRGSSQTSPMMGLFVFRTLPPGKTREAAWTEFRPVYAALWEQFQPETPIEVLLLDKIAADLIRCGRLLTFDSLYSSERYPYDPCGLPRADSISRNQAAVWRQLVQDIRELERVQQERKARTDERHASKGWAEGNAVPEPDWTAVVPSASALESEYRQQLETRAVRAANVETKPTSSELGKPNGATAPKPVARKEFGLDVPERPVHNVDTNSTSLASRATTPPAAGNGKESSTL